MSRKRGFTLVELLVVIAIIALLMSILLPAMSRVRRQAKAVMGQANLKQWGTCFAMYAGDWDNSAPRGWWSGSASGLQPQNTDYWMEALRPYYGNEHDLRCCPMATKPESTTGSVPGTFTAWGIFAGDDCGEQATWWAPATQCDYGSYGMNAWVCNPPPDAPFFQQHDVAKNNFRTFQVKGAARVPLLGDEQWVDCWPMQTDLVPEYEGEPCGNYSDYSHMVRVCLSRHNAYVNWVFMDYSVRRVGLKELWRLYWHKGYQVNDPSPTDWDDPDHWMFGMRDYD